MYQSDATSERLINGEFSNRGNRDYQAYVARILSVLFGLLSLGGMAVNLYFLVILVSDMKEIKGYLDYYLGDTAEVEAVLGKMECLLNTACKMLKCHVE